MKLLFNEEEGKKKQFSSLVLMCFWYNHIFQMTIAKPSFLILLILLLGNTGLVFSQNDTIPPQIINPDNIPAQYCSDSILVAPNISIQNIKIDEDKEGMKVSIANYKRGEDMLVWKQVYGFEYVWDNVYGHVEIKGPGNEKQYEEAVANIYYKNISSVPTLGLRSFSISLLDADYLPQTQHFYRYISKRGIKWTEARDSASNMSYYGLQGYLVTITSSVENDFVWGKIDGIGWIGANDSLVEGKWQWETGPEKGTHFWQGASNGYRVNGRFSLWNSGEPNNVQKSWGDDEDYAHVNANPSTIPKSWNDLPNEGDKETPNGYYFPQGFIVEFGGMDGDPEVKLSASAAIQVRKIAFSDDREFEICKGESQMLNLEANNSYIYSWTPVKFISDPTVSNPYVNPTENTIYTAVGSLDFCTDTAAFFVQVNPLPESKLSSNITICKGNSVTLNPGIHTKYLWSNGADTRTITVADEGNYWVKLSNAFDCDLVDTVEVKWSVSPVLDYSTVDTLVCGSKSQTLNISFVGDVTGRTKLISLDTARATVSGEATPIPTITVTEYGKYQFEMQISDIYGCQFLDTLNIEFHNQPEAIIVMDEEKCKGYSLELSFGGTILENAMFSWYYNDSVFQSGINLSNIIIPLGYGEINRTVGLKVNEQGCVDLSMQDVIVTPNVEILADNNEGCTPLVVQFEAKATEAVKSYFWDFGDGRNSDIQNPSNEFINSETADLTFDIGLTVVSTEGCENTGTIANLVVVHPKPSVDFSFEEDDCNTDTMEIWYVGSGNKNDTYNWDLSSFKPEEILKDPGTTMGPLEVKRSSEPTAKLGIHVVSEFACNSDTISKTWQRKPIFEIIVDTTEGCPPLDVRMQAIVLDDVDNVAFNYNLGDGTTGTGDFVEHIFTAANSKNEIKFTGTSALTGCSETLIYIKEVVTYPVPEAKFVANPEDVLISEPEIHFENETSGAISYEWDFGDMSAISAEHSPTHRYADMGFYTVLLSAYNDFGCLDSVSIQVAVAFDKLFPPNAFSPNAHLEEDREFRIYSEGVSEEAYQMLVFNRWGEVIFESNSQKDGWNGKMKNDNFAPSGVYTWVLQYNDFRGKKHKQQGTVTLVF